LRGEKKKEQGGNREWERGAERIRMEGEEKDWRMAG
jgi:hypothetical protein